MRSASWAEWLIARFTEPANASSIVGDFIEAPARSGCFWFWVSVSGVIVSLACRRWIGFVAAIYLGLYAAGRLQTPIWGMRSAHRPPPSWMPIFAVLYGLGIVLWIAAPYVALRYGLRDKFVQVVLGFVGLVTLVIFYWWISGVAASCVLAGLVLIAASLASSERRRSLLALVIASVLSIGGGLGVMFLWAGLQPPQEMMQYWMGSLVAPVAIVAIITTSCARVHRTLLRRSQAPSHTGIATE